MYEKEIIFQLCNKALALAPEEYPPTLPTSRELLGAPQWYPFEHQAWKLGEEVRQVFLKQPKLKKVKEIQDKIIEVVKCQNLRRGRQSFIILLGFKDANQFKNILVPLLKDDDVDGQTLDSLIKMRAYEFPDKVVPHLSSRYTWIKNLAKKYIENSKNV